MSVSRVMQAVSTAFKFTSDKVTENLLEFAASENLELTDDQKRRMAFLVQGSIEQSLSLTASSIEKSVDR